MHPQNKRLKFNILLTTYEILLKDKVRVPVRFVEMTLGFRENDNWWTKIARPTNELRIEMTYQMML